MSEWKTMESAPKDGTPVLLAFKMPIKTDIFDGWVPFGDVQVVFGWWEDTTWILPFMDEGASDSYGTSITFYLGQISPLPLQPTHWQPLPTPPEG